MPNEYFKPTESFIKAMSLIISTSSYLECIIICDTFKSNNDQLLAVLRDVIPTSIALIQKHI